MTRSISEARRAIEAQIEQLIELLDVLDGDADLEPWLSRGERIDQSLYQGDNGCLDLEEGGDDEETLGWSNPMGLRVHVREEAAQLRKDVMTEVSA